VLTIEVAKNNLDGLKTVKTRPSASGRSGSSEQCIIIIYLVCKERPKKLLCNLVNETDAETDYSE